MSRSPFSKTIGDFDRIVLSASGAAESEWLNIEMHVGFDAEVIRMTLRSDEAVADLHYALGRYLAHINPTVGG